MPDVWVFPGGAVDPEDHTAPVLAPLPGAQAEIIRKNASRCDANALAVAALRETYEETGLLIGERRAGQIHVDAQGLEYLGRAITPAESPTRYHARFFLARGEGARGRLRSNGELLDLSWLSFEEAGALPIINVTSFILDEAHRRLRGERTAGAPFIHFRKGAALQRYE
jgi:8-oxo-dGTP pyrophosphatase MutT (NUDIX family)